MNVESKYPLVSIITVNYNTAEVTLELLESLNSITYKNIEIIVVDNASSKDASTIPQKFPGITFIQNSINEGFAGGNNRGIEKAKGEIIFLLNNDTEVAPSFIEPVIELFEKDDKIGIVSSKLIYHHSKNIIQYAGSKGINSLTARGTFIGTGEEDKGQYNKPANTALAHGAAMAIHRKVIDKIGMLPEVYFLYYEEMDFCEHAKRNGFTIWFQPASVVYHKESMSVGKLSAMKIYYLNRNRLLFIRRNIFGIKGIISRLFFILVAVPKSIITYLLQGNKEFAKKIWEGLLWNFNNKIQ